MSWVSGGVRVGVVIILAAAAVNAQSGPKWVGTWAAAQQLVETRNELPRAVLRGCTLRQIVQLSIGGSEVRLRLSNRFGHAPLQIAAVHIARSLDPASPRIAVENDRTVTFSGAESLTIPAGAEYVSDRVRFMASAHMDVAITLYMEDPPAEQTGHPGSRATSYVVLGNHVQDGDLREPLKIEHWYFIAGIDVSAAPNSAAIVALGDSITDGHGATTNGNDRWTDDLARRLTAEPKTHDVAVLNQGIGGNRVLLDGLGPNAVARFKEDVVVQPGVAYVIILEGVNDIGELAREHEVTQSQHDATVQQIESAYAQMILAAHNHGIKAIGGTILPFGGSDYYHPSAATEADREAINGWIRAKGNFDEVIDFDLTMRDPQNPTHLLAGYDSGDHLHPSPAGYAAMAGIIPLTLFGRAVEPGPK